MYQALEVFGWEKRREILAASSSGFLGNQKKKKKGICKPERPRMKNSGPSPEVRSLRWEKRLLVWGYGFYPVKI